MEPDSTELSFNLIVACDRQGGIGKNGGLPWQLPGDMAFFRRTTLSTLDRQRRNAVIMGRKTWQSIPEKFRPLKGRLNVVITGNRQLSAPPDVPLAGSLEEALRLCSTAPSIEQIFVIGGGAVYAAALQHPGCRRVYKTEVQGSFQCDTFLPDLSERFRLLPAADSPLQTDGEISYLFRIYERGGPVAADAQPASQPVSWAPQ